MIFRRVTRQDPCPVCGKDNWCQFGDRAVKCMRVESSHTDKAGGWWHFYDELGLKPVEAKPAPMPARKGIDAARLMRVWRGNTRTFQFNAVAEALGVKAEALIVLGAAWSPEYAAWAFPMRDEHGETIGIRLRAEGRKWTVGGTREGLFMADMPAQSIAYCPEGPTNSAALISLGFYVIGRPSCNSGHDLLAKAVRRLNVHSVVIVADSDPLKKLGNREGRPGIEGAQACKKRLGVKSCFWIPPAPCKDARDFLKAGGTKALVEAMVNTRVWSK